MALTSPTYPRYLTLMTLAQSSGTALARAIEAAGSQSELGRRLGLRQSTISSWLLRSGRVPAEHVLAVEAATGVSRHDLRPDIYPRESFPPVSAPAAPDIAA